MRGTGQSGNESRSCYTVAHGVGVQFLVKVLNESKLISKGSWHKPTKHKGSWQNTQKIKGNGRQLMGKLQQFVTWRKPTWSKQITKDEKLRFPFYYNHFFSTPPYSAPSSVTLSYFFFKLALARFLGVLGFGSLGLRTFYTLPGALKCGNLIKFNWQRKNKKNKNWEKTK